MLAYDATLCLSLTSVTNTPLWPLGAVCFASYFATTLSIRHCLGLDFLRVIQHSQCISLTAYERARTMCLAVHILVREWPVRCDGGCFRDSPTNRSPPDT